MSLTLYTAATGMASQELKLANAANNLANINTTAFKRTDVNYQDLPYNELKPKGSEIGGGNISPVGIEVGNGSQVISTSRVFTQGRIEPTGKDLDFAIIGDGFFEVQQPDGTTAYTKAGALKLGPDGRVTTADGRPVLSGFQPIPAGSTLHVSETGNATVETPTGITNFTVQLTRFANPDGLKSMGGNVFVETEASGAPETGNPGENGFGSIRQKFLEMSNVDVAEQMIELIKAQRAYEANSKSIQAADETMSRTNQLKH